MKIIPIEKLKGEINDIYTMLYVGKDEAGNLYKCSWLGEAIEGNNWKPLSKNDYEYYHNNLSCLPIEQQDSKKNKGLSL